jgi:hypothetical protein
VPHFPQGRLGTTFEVTAASGIDLGLVRVAGLYGHGALETRPVVRHYWT